MFASALCLAPAGTCHLCALLVPHSRASVLPGRDPLYTSGSSDFTPGDPDFVAATQEIPLDYLVLEARGACSPGSYGTVTFGERVFGRIPLPRHCIDRRLKDTPTHSEKESYLLVMGFVLRGSLLLWHT